MRFLLYSFLVLGLVGCDAATLQQLANAASSAALSQADIGNGLKEALSSGIGKGVVTLSQKDGFLKSPYKILLPPEVRKVTDKLKNVPGFTNVEEVLLEKINRGAEDAASKAKPIFIRAIKDMTFQDATQILMGDKNAATAYLNRVTNAQLYKEFNPVIVASLDKFSARKYWSDAANAYNKIPFVNKVNADLDDYVTTQALAGLFGMVEKEELNIRTNLSARNTNLMRKVFAKQDNK